MDEKQYKDALERAVRLAHEGRNTLTEEEYGKIFSPLSMTDEQHSLTRRYFEELHIKIGERAEVEKDDDLPLTAEDGNYLSFYLESLNSLKSYSPEERLDLYKRALSDEFEDIKGELINAHLKDVVDIAKLYVYHGMRLEDLIGEGNIGLMMAVDLLGTLERAEEAEGFIGKTIMDAMDAAIKNDRDLKDELDRMLERVNKITLLSRELSEDMRRDLTLEEIAENSEYSFDEVNEAFQFTGGKIPGIKR